jgi:hypothetical protein
MSLPLFNRIVVRIESWLPIVYFPGPSVRSCNEPLILEVRVAIIALRANRPHLSKPDVLAR